VEANSDLAARSVDAQEMRNKLDLAARYLHDVGHLVLLENIVHLDGTFVVLNPAWLCEKVVGNLLIPQDMRKEDIQRELAPKEGVVNRALLVDWYQRNVLGERDRITGEWLVKTDGRPEAPL
jgi:hypothetical protein